MLGRVVWYKGCGLSGVFIMMLIVLVCGVL